MVDKEDKSKDVSEAELDENEKLSHDIEIKPDEEPVSDKEEKTIMVKTKEKAKKAEEAAEEKKPAPSHTTTKKADKKEVKMPEIKLFNRWSSDVELKEPGLKNYISLKPVMLPRSAGSQRRRFHKSKMHIAERLALHMLVPGHKGKKHRLTSGPLSGGYANVMKKIEKALEIIEKKEKKNPVEVLVRAVENAAAREEIISYQLGSIVAREAVITAPQRRVDKTLRYFAQAAYRQSFNKKTKIENALAEELILAAQNSEKSDAIKERQRIEREASGAR